MRIAILVSAFPLLSEAYVLAHATSLLDRGHDVTIYADQPAEKQPVHPDVERYGLRERIVLPPAIASNYLERGARAGGLLLANLGLSPSTLLASLNVLRYGRHASSLRLLNEALAYGGQGSYDVIHCHFGRNGIRGAHLREIGALEGKLVTTFHGNDATAYVRRHGPACYARLFEAGDLFVAVSEELRQRLIGLGCPEERIVVQHVGVDLTLFAPPTAAALAGRETRLVTTSRLVPKKGVEYGIRAAAALSKAGHAVQYTIVGDGQLRPHLEQLAFRLGAERIVRFLGWQRQPEVAAILADSDILLAPSVTAPDGDQEGIPVAIMEAMAMALPVVSTWHGGIPELVRDGVTGILVREGDTETLAAGVARLIEHPEVRAAMGQAGRARVAAEHNASIQADRLVDLYRRVLAVGESPHTTYGAAPHE